MSHLLNIESSPRSSKSASITIADAFLKTWRASNPDSTVDTLNVWEEDLREFDSEAIGAKYKGAAGEYMEAAESAIWQRIRSPAERFHAADRIVLGVPMWNFAYPYKLKQLIDLACQRNLLFSFDGQKFGPLLRTLKALVIYTQGQGYAEGFPTPASNFDYRTGYIDFLLRFLAVQNVTSITAEILGAVRLKRILLKQPRPPQHLQSTSSKTPLTLTYFYASISVSPLVHL